MTTPIRTNRSKYPLDNTSLPGVQRVRGVNRTLVIVNLTMTTANTEYTFTFPAASSEFTIKAMNGSTVTYTTVSGGDVFTIPRNTEINQSELDLAAPLTLFFESNKANTILEIKYWTI